MSEVRFILLLLLIYLAIITVIFLTGCGHTDGRLLQAAIDGTMRP